MTVNFAWMFSLTGNIMWAWYRRFLLMCTTTMNQVRQFK